MKDFPVFATEYGVGSLILREIPYSQTAYIRMEDSLAPQAFLDECAAFCKAVGAEQIYATGHSILQDYPFHTAMLQMEIQRQQLPKTDAALMPVVKSTLEQWREIYNQRMTTVPNAAYMTAADGTQMLNRGEGYFVCRDQVLLGIGKVVGNRIEAVASAVPGAGRDCLLALAKSIEEDTVILDVASTNVPAIRLYESLNFTVKMELSRWYKIL